MHFQNLMCPQVQICHLICKCISSDSFCNFQNNAYVLQNDEDEAHIELYDMVADPKFFTGADPHQEHLPKMIPNHPQPDLRQVVGLRNTLTCCVLPNRQYGKLDNEYMDHSMDTSGGTAFIVLNPRRLNGHATIPAPPMTCPSALAAHHSKWSINSANSLEDHERSHHAPSIDLEWENDGRLENFSKILCPLFPISSFIFFRCSGGSCISYWQS